MTRRSPSEIADFHRKQAEKHQAESDRRLAVASDPLCERLWKAEKRVRELATYVGQFKEGEYRDFAERLMRDRVERWADLRSQKDRS